MGSCKTPVTLLQELLIKHHSVPTYELVMNGCGTHDPIFQYEVFALGKTATGSGKSKKEAKHVAAQNMLTQLERNHSSVNLPDVASPFDCAVKENAVGELQEFCLMNQLMLPQYELVRDEGLPHAKVFTYTCTVSSFTTEATSRTKKNAKHMVAQEMLSNLKAFLGEKAITEIADTSPPSPSTAVNDHMDGALDEVIKKLPKHLKKIQISVTSEQNLGDLCFALTDRNMPDLLYLDSIKERSLNELESPHETNYEEIFTKIVNEMQCEFDIFKMESLDDKRVVAIVLDSMPMWTFVGAGNSIVEAHNAAYEDAVKFMAKMRI